MGFGPAFKDGKLQHVSASQMSTFESCRYAWYAAKILKRPSLQDWSWAHLGVAIHQILDEQVSSYLDKDPKEEDRLLPSETMEEAQNEVDWFDWEKYFLGHEIIDSEMESRINLGDELPDLVLAADVVSRIVAVLEELKYGHYKIERDETGVLVVTDWKTGYGSDKGVDIQVQAYTFALMEIFDEDFILFRRIYPRLPGEAKGWRKVEEYMVSRQDAARYERRVKLIASQMKMVAEGKLKATTNPSDRCAFCDVAHDCPAVKKEATSVAELVEKMKVYKAGLSQIEAALKKAAEKDDLIVGDEIYGFNVSQSWGVSRKVGAQKAGEMIFKADPNLFAKNASLKIDDEVAKKLNELGVETTISSRRLFKFKNEKELKEAAKSAKKAETTSGTAA